MSENPNERKKLPPTISEEKKKEIVGVLQEKGVPKTCPMCQQNNWVLADGYFNPGLQTNLRGLTIGGPSIPSIAIICTNCGFMSEHALGVIGMLPDVEEAE